MVDHLGAAAEPPDAVVAAGSISALKISWRARSARAARSRSRPPCPGAAPNDVADLRAAEPHEADVAQAFAGRLLHHEQRVRSLQLENELAAADLRHFGVVVAFAELVVGPSNAGTAGEEIILLGELHQHAFAHDLAGAVAEDDVLGLPDVELRKAVDRDAEKNFSASRPLTRIFASGDQSPI